MVSLSKVHVVPIVLVNTKEAVLHSDKTEKLLTGQKQTNNNMMRVMKKTTFFICENKGKCEAD